MPVNDSEVCEGKCAAAVLKICSSCLNPLRSSAQGGKRSPLWASACLQSKQFGQYTLVHHSAGGTSLLNSSQNTEI